MKEVLIVFGALLATVSASMSAQVCKPDVSKSDLITKQRSDMWTHRLWETGTLTSALVTNSDVEISAFVERGGATRSIGIQLEKREEARKAYETLERAALESKLHAVKGSQFLFGMKNGQPLSFVATAVNNETKPNYLGQMVTTVILSAEVPDQALTAMQEALTTSQIDAVRIVLAGDLTIEKTIGAKNSERMKEKFACFYRALALSTSSTGCTAVSSDKATSMVGRFERKAKTSDFFELDPNGTFQAELSGLGAFAGTYAIRGDEIKLNPKSWRIMTFTGRITDSGFTIPFNGTFERRSVCAPTTATLTIDQIVQMLDAKVSEDVIVATIGKSGAKFDLSPEELIRLKKAGASDALLNAMAR